MIIKLAGWAFIILGIALALYIDVGATQQSDIQLIPLVFSNIACGIIVTVGFLFVNIDNKLQDIEGDKK